MKQTKHIKHIRPSSEMDVQHTIHDLRAPDGEPLVRATPYVWIATMTRQLGEALLKANTANRTPIAIAVEGHANTCRRGEWKLTSQGVSLGRDGVLTNGQNRLFGMQAAGWPPVEVIVLIGADPDSRLVEDTGVKRQLAHMLELALGRDLRRAVGPVLNCLARSGVNWGKRPQVAAPEALELLAEFGPEIEAVLSTRLAGKGFGAPVCSAFVRALAQCRSERPAIMALIERITTKVGIAGKEDPAAAFLRWNDSGADSTSKNQHVRYYKTWAVIMAACRKAPMPRLDQSDSGAVQKFIQERNPPSDASAS